MGRKFRWADQSTRGAELGDETGHWTIIARINKFGDKQGASGTECASKVFDTTAPSFT